jgi:ATP-dependent DNA helicase RecG
MDGAPSDRLIALVDDLLRLPAETEWVEFKFNNTEPERMARTASALSNAARLADQHFAYILWGIRNEDHEIIGSDFEPSTTRRQTQPLLLWLARALKPDVNFEFHSVPHPKGRVLLLQIPAAVSVPTKYDSIAYIRIGETTPKLSDHPQREAALLDKLRPFAWETGIALGFARAEHALELLDTKSYFDLTGQRVPADPQGILQRLEQDKLIARDVGERWNILNLGAVLFATRLDAFGSIARKAVRVVQYADEGRTRTIRETTGTKGYATGFEGLMSWLRDNLPGSEKIGEEGRRERVAVYPPIALRELVANALIHQDLTITGAGPMIEIFIDRIEITNPGRPLIEPNRFLDLPPRSRNESLAALMRRAGICEERGSGIDKVVEATELARLPPPDFLAPEDNTLAILYGPRTFAGMGTAHRVRACYWHAVLCYVRGFGMTNASLRDRFGLDEGKSSQVSRIINQAEEAGYIRACPDWSPRTGYYWPSWAFS